MTKILKNREIEKSDKIEILIQFHWYINFEGVVKNYDCLEKIIKELRHIFFLNLKV